MPTNEKPFGRPITRRGFLASAALAGVGASALLTACAGGSAGGSGGGTSSTPGKGGSLTWASWANPGEAERFRQISKDYEAAHGSKVTFQVVVGDYGAKLLTQLAGNSGPDVFYVQDSGMQRLIQSKNVADFTEFTSKPDSPLRLDDLYPNLMEWCKPADGSPGTYGLVVDCNPIVFWFNKDMAAAAGITQNPAQLQESGTWNRDALDDFLTKIKATGKRGMVLEGGFGPMFSWMTAFGGKVVDGDKAIFNEDAKSMETLEWLWEGMANRNITYGGSLPKGQGIDALFYGQQLASCQMGRWILPNLKKLKFGYDIAPFASADGKTVPPVIVYTAAMGVNAKAKDPEAAMYFATRFVNKDGQKARLSGGGNAVPATAGLEDVVLENKLPEHCAWFTDVAKNGYAIPPAIASKAEVGANLGTEMDKSIKAGDSAKVWADKICKFINNGS
ncbi:multiple sugar transport system substrate-binding protein [Kribbella orskensis]|uniref:Multiple sugar transport system substrate-binding protein n=1 Tax=Kribbella orskensis TaxID=2512216 RepID=A0ABY2BFV8_9ACTN|nr:MULTISPECIES: extracellular solute-binding protein [Kribbella]TCN35519.1 multiple sugar transport system substrate-binding protein [Kribbella sp. VKM Ac-2500]TCO17061.1 multiple sugar transport system substrate-binding protein [Kribbella orskensis]